MFPEFAGVLGEFLVHHHLQCRDAHFCSHRIAAEGGPVLAGMDNAHDGVVGQDRADRIGPAG